MIGMEGAAVAAYCYGADDGATRHTGQVRTDDGETETCLGFALGVGQSVCCDKKTGSTTTFGLGKEHACSRSCLLLSGRCHYLSLSVLNIFTFCVWHPSYTTRASAE